jgi:bifunctional non-homologous end joining protein LigD
MGHAGRAEMAFRSARRRSQHPEHSQPLPDFIAPQLAIRVEAAPDGEMWLHELKLDGYRMLARVQAGQAQLLTRTGKDWTQRMPLLASALQKLRVDAALLDGEVVALDAHGRSDFQLLQNSLHAGGPQNCLYFAFDLLHQAGEDLRALPLLQRKQRLEALLNSGHGRGPLRYSEHVIGNGREFLLQACKRHAEGIVSKRCAAPYVSRRDRSWLKVKCVEREAFVIGGFTLPAGARTQMGALLLGSYDAGALRYAGRVGTGFTQASLAELHEKLSCLTQNLPAFSDPPQGAQAIGVTWVRPELVAEIEYAERTQDGLVRHASFHGLRQDKPANDVGIERVSRRSQRPKPR